MAVLIKRNQIEGLVEMYNDLNDELTGIKNVYPASKVSTTNVRVEATENDPAIKYNAQELLTELKTNVDGILNGSQGITLPELLRLINKLNAELNGGSYMTALGDDGVLQTLEGFKNKEINDVVRMVYSWNKDTGTVTITNPVTKPDEVNISANAALPAYVADTGERLVNSAGQPVSFNIQNETFNSSNVPYIIDVEASMVTGGINSETGKLTDDEHYVYKEFNGNFKVFPVGTWTLENLPATALLDNNEMQLLAYDQALQKVIIQLAKDKNLIDRITQSVGLQAVEDAVKDSYQVIDTRIDRLEGNPGANSDLSKVAVKVSQVVPAPTRTNLNVRSAAETLIQLIDIPSLNYLLDIAKEIKNDIGSWNFTTNTEGDRVIDSNSIPTSYDANGFVQPATVRTEIRSISNKMLYKDKLIAAVKASTDGAVHNNTIDEYTLVAKFADLDSIIDQHWNAFLLFRDTTAPDTYVSYAKVVNTFDKTEVEVSQGVYTDPIADSAHPEVAGKKMFFEEIAKIIDNHNALDAAAYRHASIVTATAVSANSVGQTAKLAEEVPADRRTIPVLSKLATEYLVKNEEERAIFQENRIDAAAYQYANIKVNVEEINPISVQVATYNSNTGATGTTSDTFSAATPATAETLTRTVPVSSQLNTERRVEQLNRITAYRENSIRQELIDRIAFTDQQIRDTITLEINKLLSPDANTILLDPARAGDSDIVASAALAAVDRPQSTENGQRPQGIGPIADLYYQKVNYSQIVTSAGYAAVSDNTGVTETIIANAVAAEAAATLATPVTSKRYVDDQITYNIAQERLAVNQKLKKVDDRVDRVESIEDIIERIQVAKNAESFTTKKKPYTTAEDEIVVFINGIAYFSSDGVFTITNNDTNVTINWQGLAAGFYLQDVMPNGGYVTVKYKYINTNRVTAKQLEATNENV